MAIGSGRTSAAAINTMFDEQDRRRQMGIEDERLEREREIHDVNVGQVRSQQEFQEANRRYDTALQAFMLDPNASEPLVNELNSRLGSAGVEVREIRPVEDGNFLVDMSTNGEESVGVYSMDEMGPMLLALRDPEVMRSMMMPQDEGDPDIEYFRFEDGRTQAIDTRDIDAVNQALESGAVPVSQDQQAKQGTGVTFEREDPETGEVDRQVVGSQDIPGQQDLAGQGYRRVKDSGINIQMGPGEKTEEQERAKSRVRRYDQVMESYMGAAQRIPQIQAQRTAIESERFESGSLGDLRASMGRFAQLIGLDPTKIPKLGDPAAADVIDSYAAQIATNMLSDLQGIRGTNMALRLMTDSVPSLYRTLDGNLILSEIMERVANRQLEAGELAMEYDAAGIPLSGNEEYPSLDQAIAELEREDPVISKDLERRIRLGTRRMEEIDYRDLPILPPSREKWRDGKLYLSPTAGIVYAQGGVAYPYNPFLGERNGRSD